MNFKDYIQNIKQYAPLLLEGGAMPGVGVIHISEIKPTLSKLQQELIAKLGSEKYNQYFDGDLIDNALGSVGKKEFSGDMDISINIGLEDKKEFAEILQSLPSISEVKSSSVIMASVDIAQYDNSLDSPIGKERTGKVQVDFMPGEREWMQTFYHSPNIREGESKYSGFTRNLTITTIVLNLPQEVSEIDPEDPFERPKEIIRYKYGFNGLVKVKRTPGKSAAGKYLKKNDDEVVGGPWKTKEEIAKILKLDSPDDLNSFESLYSAVNKKYPTELANKIFNDLKQSLENQGQPVPEEIE